jgi:exonuclease VII small subunit
MEALKTRLDNARRVCQQWENGIVTADECRTKLESYGVTVSDEEFRAMTRDEDGR